MTPEPQTPHIFATGSDHYVQIHDPDLTISTMSRTTVRRPAGCWCVRECRLCGGTRAYSVAIWRKRVIAQRALGSTRWPQGEARGPWRSRGFGLGEAGLLAASTAPLNANDVGTNVLPVSTT